MVAPLQAGVSFENSAFTCIPTNVNLTLNEDTSC